MRVVCLLLLLVAACGEVHHDPTEAPDAPAVPDAPPATQPARPASGLVSAAGRMTGGTLTVDIEVGRAIAVQRTSGGSITATPTTALTP